MYMKSDDTKFKFPQDVFSKDLILHLQRDGIKLTFDSNSQRLNLIQVIDMKLVQLTYG